MEGTKGQAQGQKNGCRAVGQAQKQKGRFTIRMEQGQRARGDRGAGATPERVGGTEGQAQG